MSLSDEDGRKPGFIDRDAQESDDNNDNERPADSSDEEEDEDDEEEMAKIRQGFIVDDEEEDEEEEDDENASGSEDRGKKRRHRHKKRRHKEKTTDDALDEDDLDLLMENTGAAPRSTKSKFKRLKRGSAEDEAIQSRKGGAQNALDDIFSDDEQALGDGEDLDGEDIIDDRQPNRRRSHLDEMDDFIEEDSDEDEDQARERQPSRSYRPQVSSTVIPQYSDIDQEKLDQLFEIFGDGTDYEWALELEEEGDIDNVEESDEENVGGGAPKLTDIFEQTELQEKMLTEEDNQIRITDIPERFQSIRAGIKHYKLNPDEFLFEKSWVSESLGSEKVDFLSKNSNLLEPFNEAVGDVLTFICEDSLEVPFIWTHRKDFITYTSKDPNSGKLSLIDLLKEDDLWRIVQLDVEFHSLLQKKKTIVRLLKRIGEYEQHEEIIESLTKIQEFQDFYEYVLFTYSGKLREIEANGENAENDDEGDLDEAHEDDDYDPLYNDSSKKSKLSQKKAATKRHSKYSAWDRIRNSELYEMVKYLGITSSQVGANISTTTREFFTQDREEDPEALIEELATRPGSSYSNPKLALNVVEKMFGEELYHEPQFRTVVRTAFTQFARINVKLTEKGKVKITKGSSNYDFKYLINKEIASFVNEPSLLLRMLNAEQESLIQINIVLPSLKEFVDHVFNTSLASDGESEISSKWNAIRKNALEITMKKIIPLVCMNIKEDLRKECERLLFFKVRNSVVKKLDQAPYKPPGFVHGTVPETFTLSCGEGNFHTDAVVGVYTNSYGEVKEFVKFDQNPVRDPEFGDIFAQKIEELKPDVIGINGYNVHTKRLYDVIKQVIEKEQLRPESSEGDYSQYENGEPPLIELVFVPDEIARLYQNSKRAKEDFPERSSLAKYCVALSRFLQSPLLEYINLGSDVKSVHFHKYQYLLGEERLTEAITTAFVDIVNMVGVDINQALREPYYAKCLQYVGGLGPRKASGLLQSIQSKSSKLVNRASLVTANITATNIFMNCSSFLKFYESSSDRFSEHADVLDETRIHPEDYVLATKMAADALELDEEDIEDLENRTGEGVIRKLDEGNNLAKLNELILEDYATELETKHGKKKRATLYMIKDELQNHFEEIRHRFHIMNSQEIFLSLTGESTETFYAGVVCTVVIKKVSNRFLSAVTQFLVNCNISKERMLDYNDRRMVDEVFHAQQAVQAKILEIDYENFRCEGSVLRADVSQPEENPRIESFRKVDEWDEDAEINDIRLEKLKLESENKPKKFVKHPFFHNFNAIQAEEYLASLSRGDLVIRPSSKGIEHLAITWKVDNALYQHLDVVEKVTVGSNNEESKSYIVKGYRYSDLDELITFHINKLAKFVESMVNHDKFYKKSRAEAEGYLDSYIKANSGRGYYIFCFDHKRPGWFTLLFKGSEKAKIYSLPVEVNPNGYRLEGYQYGSVGLLTNGFKQLMKTKFQQQRQQRNGGPADAGGRYGSSNGQMYSGYARGY